MAGPTANAAPAATATGVGAIFKWDIAANPTSWTKNMVVEIKQTNAISPVPEGLTPYLMIYEADKNPWNEIKESDNSGLQALLALQGAFDAAGKFSVSKTI